MSTDWSTGKNKKFGNNEVFLKLSNALANIGLKNDNETVETARTNFYNVYKRNNLCDASGSWILFDRYNSSSNMYTENELDNVFILNESKNKDLLFTKEDDNVEEKRTYISGLLSSYINDGLCNEILLTGFFPHLDIVNKIELIESTSGYVPCYEIGTDTLYALISYTDGCGQNIVEPVPSITGSVELVRNTSFHPDDENASYAWSVISDDADNILLKNNADESILKLTCLSSATYENITISLNYSE